MTDDFYARMETIAAEAVAGATEPLDAWADTGPIDAVIDFALARIPDDADPVLYDFAFVGALTAALETFALAVEAAGGDPYPWWSRATTTYSDVRTTRDMPEAFRDQLGVFA